MIIIPKDKQKNVLFADFILTTSRDNCKEFYIPYTQGRPFAARDDRGDWIILQLKIDIHDTLSSYKLYTQHILGENGIEEYFCIDFDDKDQELLFKLKYL